MATGIGADLQPRRSALHSVVVASKDETHSGEEVLEKLRKAINAKEGWVKIKRVRKAKDQKVILGFSTTGERDKVKERLAKEGADLTVEEVKNKDPLLIIKEVLSVNTDDEILKVLKNQNRDIFGPRDGEEDRLMIKYRRRASV